MGGPHNKDYSILGGVFWGPPILGNYQLLEIETTIMGYITQVIVTPVIMENHMEKKSGNWDYRVVYTNNARSSSHILNLLIWEFLTTGTLRDHRN